MKLCRFELKDDPGNPRSGMVFAGKVYETDGANAIGVYEAEAVRPLSPVPQPGSIRLFRTDLQPELLSEEDPSFFYTNPASLVGGGTMIMHPGFGRRVGFETYLAAVLVSGGYRVPADIADELILGITVMNVLTLPDEEARERQAGGGFGKSHDIGSGIGPVLTTPDELEDEVSNAEFGRRYRLSAVVRIDGVERARGNTDDLPFTLAQAIETASRTCTLKPGDVIALGPITESEFPIELDETAEVQVAVEKLGTLTLRISPEI